MSFTPTSVKDLYNLGFGDLLPDGSIDDKANSNNGDIVKVLATVVYILKEFTNNYPHVKIIFTGSTEERTLLYQRILKTYYSDFSKNFLITGLIQTKDGYEEIVFEPDVAVRYVAFLIERIN